MRWYAYLQPKLCVRSGEAMKIQLFIMLCLMCVLITASAGVKEGDYSQSYVILIKGEPSGIENVIEKNGSNGERIATSEHEIIVTDGVQTNRMAFTTRMVFSKSTGNTGDSYEVTIKNGLLTRILNRGGRASNLSAPFLPNMVILDFNVYHQYDYLIRKYDMKKSGRQVFANFIPVIGNDIPLAVTFLDNEMLKNSIGSLAVKNFRVECVGIWIGSISMDPDGRLVRLEIPSQGLQVIRKDFLQ
jgi:hypothetical protein